MKTLLRSLILLALAVWIGGLLFFGAVLAPVAFGTVMPMFSDPAFGIHIAGTIVRVSLMRLHDVGLVCGFVLLVSILVERIAHFTQRSLMPQLVLLAAMLGLTAYSQFFVIPRMDTLRVQHSAAVDNPTSTDPARMEFNKLHNLSTNLEGVVLVCGIGLIVLYARPEPAV